MKLKLIGANLSGNAARWFNAVKDDVVINVESFIREYQEMFGRKTEKSDEKRMVEFFSILNKGLRPGQMENDCWILFENYKESGIKLEVVKEQLTKNLTAEIGKRISNVHSWKRLVQEAAHLDHEYQNDKIIREKMKERTQYILQKEGVSKHPRECYCCKRKGHLKKDCFKLKNDTNKEKISVINIKEQVDRRPRLKIQFGGYTFNALLDTGASASYISKGTAEKINLHIFEEKSKVSLAKGKCTTSGIGYITLQTDNESHEITIKFLVIENLMEDIILGVNAMELLKITDIFSKKIKIFGNLEVKNTNVNSIMLLESKYDTKYLEFHGKEKNRHDITVDQSNMEAERIKELVRNYRLFMDEKSILYVGIQHEIHLKDEKKI
ncbi:hypothetical protein H311_02101 [Anncaliia algerae PRA109]|nr:hypothetical protein H311_02101 [Anncaliia algerae PRA109]